MQQVRQHEWNLPTAQAVQLQNEFAQIVERDDRIAPAVRHVAGVDVAYGIETNSVYAAVVIIDLQSMETVETASAVREEQTDYVPGLFAYRELPALCEATAQIQCIPDLVICDGQGVAHPRRCGVASHFGLLFDVPTIGCGKTRLLGTHVAPGPNRGDFADLIDQEEVIGSVLRTQDGINPLYISTGHRVSLPTAREWILRLASEYRQPEPIRRANQLANEVRAAANSG